MLLCILVLASICTSQCNMGVGFWKSSAFPPAKQASKKKPLQQREEKSKNTNKNGLWLVFSCCPSPKYSDLGPKIIAFSWEGQDFVVFQF